MKKQKILLFDVESSPSLGYSWQKYDTNIIEFVKEFELLSFAWKWHDQKTTYCLSRQEFKDKTDKSLLLELHKLLKEADIVISHNGDSFDNRLVRARFIVHNIKPPRPYKTIDTKKVAKKHFRFNSNSLNDLGKILGVGQKFKHQGFQLWVDCMANKPEAWKIMKKYNKQDVVLLEKVYLKLLPWISNHPNINITDQPQSCPKCGSDKLVSRGVARYASGTFQRYRCNSCGGWCRSTKSIKEHTKPRITNV